MGVMTAVDADGRFTEADFERLPVDAGDGLRYELLDGSIIVTPAPGFLHQRATVRLLRLLDDAAPRGLEVCVAPLDAYLPTGDILQPDVLVIDPAIVTDDKVRGVPLLAVEVLSPSTRRRDVGDKLTAYRDAGLPSYWVVDPLAPRLRAWRLEGGEYVHVADVADDVEWVAEAPFGVSLRPVDLVRDR
jgi:Uma2 family endonuclease